MPRSRLLPATILLATLTAVSLVAVAVSTRPTTPASLTGATEATNRTAVRRFYDTVNDVIATGDTASLSFVLSPDYLESDAADTLAPGRATLERTLLAIHAATPNLRLEATDLVGDGDRVVVFVRAHREIRTTTFGLTLDDSPLWNPVEVFRVSRGLIAERTALGRRPALLEPIVRAPVELPQVAQGVTTVSRVTLEPGGWLREPRVRGVRVLVVEAGTLEVSATPNGSTTERWGDAAATLKVGDWLVVTDGERGVGYATRNTGPDTTVYLDVLVTMSSAHSGAASATTAGAETRIMAGGQTVTHPTGSVELTITRVTLLPGVRLAWSGPAGPVLLLVEGGTLDLIPEAEADAWVRSQAGEIRRLPRAVLGAGGGALLDAGAGVEVHNKGDLALEFLIVTLAESPGEPITMSARRAPQR